MSDFQDPVEILEHALRYLETSRGLFRARASQACGILENRKQALVDSCTCEFLSDQAKAKGAACASWRHKGNFEREFYKPAGESIAALAELERYEPELLLSVRPPTLKRHLTQKELAAGEKDE